MALRKESLPRTDDEGGFVIVESGPVTQERRNLVGPTGPQELGPPEIGDRRVGRAGFGLNRHDAETEFFEELLVCFVSGATEIFESCADRVLLCLVIGAQTVDIPIPRLQRVCESDSGR